MTSFKVVSVDVTSNRSSDFLNVVIFRQIKLFILETAKPSLNHDVVSPATFPVHAPTDINFFYTINILLTCKLATLICVWNLCFCYSKCFFSALITIPVAIVLLTSQQTIQQLYKSITTVKYRNPCLIGICVISMDHAWFGASITVLRRRYWHTLACCKRFERFIFGQIG